MYVPLFQQMFASSLRTLTHLTIKDIKLICIKGLKFHLPFLIFNLVTFNLAIQSDIALP